jgi:hypothetical protein
LGHMLIAERTEVYIDLENKKNEIKIIFIVLLSRFLQLQKRIDSHKLLSFNPPWSIIFNSMIKKELEKDVIDDPINAYIIFRDDSNIPQTIDDSNLNKLCYEL